MPIGGSNIAWDNTTPADTESAGQGDDRIRSMKTSVQQALDNEHEFPTGGGAGTGSHRSGAARTYYGLQSEVSAVQNGRLMTTSDSSRLFGVGSGGTVLLGGSNVISAGSFPDTVPQRHHWVEEFGEGQVKTSTVTTVTIPNSGYSGRPYIFLNYHGADANFASIIAYSKTTFSVGINSHEGIGQSNVSFFWRSIGTRVL
jgi:hypothetical protein